MQSVNCWWFCWARERLEKIINGCFSCLFLILSSFGCLVLDLKVQSVSKQDCKVCTLPSELECTLCTLREGRAVGWERHEKKK